MEDEESWGKMTDDRRRREEDRRAKSEVRRLKKVGSTKSEVGIIFSIENTISISNDQ